MNRLANATSPYLRQHANNPVDWYQWGEEAFEAARRDDKPILLSIGYSSCHWCHVMAHESFENPEIAAFMNREFINIKVDREERPDIDDIYMQATLMFTGGHGGWPMTVFLLPDGRPIHAGTYFPPRDARGMPGFPRVMAAVLDAYRNRRDDVQDIAAQVTGGLQRSELGLSGGELTPALLEQAYQGMIRDFDPMHGGLTRSAPKFPNPMNLEYVLRWAVAQQSEEALNIVTFTLKKMARGGIYDQIGGGFARYSVDERWLVPHFEKMLYDNSQLSRLYMHTWLSSGDPFFKRIAEEIYDYILREMSAPEGGFYSTTDADSEGEEGKFFLWTPEEIRDLLPADEAEAALMYWGVTEHGNFEERNILNVLLDDDVVAKKLNISVEELQQRIDSAKHTLYAARTHRIPPGLDDKVLTAWNGMMLASLAEGARFFKRDDYRQAAIRNAEFLLTTMQKDGRLLRSYKDGVANYNGYLEDYACLLDGLLALYQLTFETRYFEAALELAEIAIQHYAAPDGGFYDTSDDHEQLIARPRSLQDNATPSGNSMMAKVLAQLSAYTGEARYEEISRRIVGQLVAAMQQYPQAFGEALNAVDLLVRGIDEVAIIGEKGDAQPLIDVVNTAYRPNAILAYAAVDQGEKAQPMLLAYRSRVQGKAAAYVCRKFVCQQPVTTGDKLAEAL
ncbi:MAG: thioredoxin domain-containing protein [Anaerolineae bacterium]|nr:thioredoxin domain-containing protein [Anaerolineae bacterium]